jgi:uncharacterized membrane protein YhaH (DUF805 family)
MDWAYLFFRFDGRISRKPYWIASGVLIFTVLVCVIGASYFEQERLFGVVGLAFLYPDFAVLIKRAHDRETPSWIPILYLVLSLLQNTLSILELDGPYDNPNTLFWIVFLPLLVVSLYLIVDLGFRKGIRGPNRFGPDPLERQTRQT